MNIIKQILEQENITAYELAKRIEETPQRIYQLSKTKWKNIDIKLLKKLQDYTQYSNKKIIEELYNSIDSQ